MTRRTNVHVDPEPFPLTDVIEYVAEHYRPLVLFLADTRVRMKEACALDIGDVDLTTDPPTMTVTKTKPDGSDNSRTVALRTARVVEVMRQAMADGAPNEPLFVTPDGNEVDPASFAFGVWVPAADHARDMLGLAAAPRLHQLRSGAWY